MNLYEFGHFAALWFFYALGCLGVTVLLVLALAWCWDRWQRRDHQRSEAVALRAPASPICPHLASCSYPHCDCHPTKPTAHAREFRARFTRRCAVTPTFPKT